jgi:hypothetical protein
MNKLILNLILISFVLLLSPVASIGNTPQNVFFSLGKGKIEIRSLAPNDSTSSIKLKNLEGNEFQLTDPPLLSSKDFEGISTSEEDMILYIKRKSWPEVRKITSEHINKQLAIVINNEVIFVPVVREPLSRILQLSGHGIISENFEHFFKKFTKTNKPKYLDDQEIYVKFMETWISEKPDDFSALQELAMLYISAPKGLTNPETLSPQKCTKAIPLFEKLIKHNPSDVNHYMNLSQCYAASAKFESAISAIEASMPYSPESQKWQLYSQIGLIYMMEGSFDKALTIFEKSKIMLQNTKMLPEGMDLQIAKMFFSVAPGPEGKINFETLEEFENYLKKESLNRIEMLIQQAKEGKKS